MDEEEKRKSNVLKCKLSYWSIIFARDHDKPKLYIYYSVLYLDL